MFKLSIFSIDSRCCHYMASFRD